MWFLCIINSSTFYSNTGELIMKILDFGVFGAIFIFLFFFTILFAGEFIGKELEKRSLFEFSKAVTERIDKHNEVDTNIAVLDQQIEEEKKRLELARLQAETNKALSEGITPQLLQQQFIEKWDRKTPLCSNNPSHSK